MRKLLAADAFAALPTFIWFYIFQAIASHYAALPAYGYSGAWDVWVYFPLVMGIILTATIGTFTFVWRRPKIIVGVAIMALLPILPYGMATSGGV